MLSRRRPYRTALAVAGLLLILPLWRPAAAGAGPDPRYWRLADVEAAFAAWAAEYPDIFHAAQLGLTGEGRAIPLARVSDHAAAVEAEPRLVFHAAQHANECNGTGAIMRTIEALLAGYGRDPAVTARVDGLDLIFVPILNVDGHVHVFGEGVGWPDWRKTLRDNDGNGEVDFPGDGVDLNRNWDWYWDEYSEVDPASQKYRGPWPWSEPETAALRDFVLAERPLVVVDYHSPVTIAYTSVVFWPWLSTHGGGMSPDADVARDVADAWAGATLDENGGPYHDLFGYDTLPKEQCWIYGHTGILTYVMEISDRCWWTGAVVDTIAARVARGSTTLMDRALHGPGIAGTVTDAATGAPLAAEVTLAELHSPDVGPRLCDARVGTYQRLTEATTYTVQVSCAGHLPQVRPVTVAPAGWTVADFALEPEPTAVAPSGNAAAGRIRLRIPGPLASGQAVTLELGDAVATARADLFDLRGRRVAALGRDLAGGGAHALTLPRGLASGVYLVEVRAGSRRTVGRLVIVD